MAEQREIKSNIRMRKWGWIDHVFRREQINMVRHSLKWNPQEIIGRGRPIITRRRNVQRDRGHHNLVNRTTRLNTDRLSEDSML